VFLYSFLKLLAVQKNEKKCCGDNHKMDEFNKKNKKNIDERHSIFDLKKCPCYQKAFKSLCRQIDMDEPTI